jgi:hypothetical protein
MAIVFQPRACQEQIRLHPHAVWRTKSPRLPECPLAWPLTAHCRFKPEGNFRQFRKVSCLCTVLGPSQHPHESRPQNRGRWSLRETVARDCIDLSALGLPPAHRELFDSILLQLCSSIGSVHFRLLVHWLACAKSRSDLAKSEAVVVLVTPVLPSKFRDFYVPDWNLFLGV